MLDPAHEEKISAAIKAQLSIFFAFATAFVMYIGVIFLTTGGRSPEPLPIPALKPLFLVIAIIAGVAKFWIQSRVLSEESTYAACRTLDELMQKFMRYNMILLALSEVPALLALIVAFITRNPVEWVPLFVISAILLATSAPRRTQLERLAEAHSARFSA